MIDQTADPDATLRVAAALFSQRFGIPVGDDWGILPNGSCQCPKGRDCTHPGKHPARRRPRESATTDLEELREYVRMGRHLAAYPVDHTVVDVEMGSGKDGLTPLRRWAELSGVDLGAMLNTLTVNTGGGGFHKYYYLPPKWRGCPPRGMDKWLPDVDIKTGVKVSDKATLPGSRHWTGGVYTFELTEDGRIPDPIAAPDALLRAIAAGRRWVPLPPEDAPAPPPSVGGVQFADFIDWQTPWRWARILRPDEPSPPRTTRDRYSSSDLPDTSRWALPNGADPDWSDAS